MIQRVKTSALPKQRALNNVAVNAPLVTIFALPKPFSNPKINLIQRNAIRSWNRLAPYVEVILLGNDYGIAETAAEFGLRHSQYVGRNRHGTPLLSDAFRVAHRMSRTPFLAYCNCDVILFDDLVKAVQRIESDRQVQSFVGFGRRTDLSVNRALDFHDVQEVQLLRARSKQVGETGPVVCKEYFVFSRDLYHEIPEFAVGRGNWDNWMISSAKRAGTPVINLSGDVQAIHQIHDYSHLKSNRLNCYVTGVEARANQRLGGGRHVVYGSTSTWQLGRSGLTRTAAAWTNHEFWRDLPRFLKLLINLPFSR